MTPPETAVTPELAGNELRRAVLLALGYTDPEPYPFHEFWSVRCDGHKIRVEDPLTPEACAYLRARMAEAGWCCHLSTALLCTLCFLVDDAGNTPGPWVQVSSDEEPDLVHRECIATCRAFLATVPKETKP